MDIATQQRNTLIALGALSGAGFILAIVRTWKWYSRSGREIIDLPTIGKLVFNTFGILGTVFLIVTAGVATWFLVFLKREYGINPTLNTSTIETLLKIFLIAGFVLKTIDIIHLIVRQTRIEIFFMDWERPKKGSFNSISIWRTYFAANEFNEIQTLRRINVPFQLLLALFFLKVINLENIAYAQNEINLSLCKTNCPGYNPIFRIAVAFLMLLGTGLVQYLAYVLFYQRVIEDKIVNFIDLCSVSNISLFILDENYHGYYIHGRSPHGLTDVNMREILVNFYREENRMSGKRGLQPDSDEQVFIVKTTRQFRRQYELLFKNYYGYAGPRKTREDFERYTNMLLESYQNLNSFLCTFIDNSLATQQYFIRNRFFLEKILDYEFRIQVRSQLDGFLDNVLFIDNEKTFTQILFYGEELSLFLWNMVTFLFIDVLATNYVLAAIITYILNAIIVGLRDSFGRKNLSKKTLIPKNFLI